MLWIFRFARYELPNEFTNGRPSLQHDSRRPADDLSRNRGFKALRTRGMILEDERR